jgi:hypothetical protein
MQTLASATPISLSGGDYQLDFYSSGGAGTGLLAFAADGTNFRTIANSSFTGSGGFIFTVCEDPTQISKWKVTLTGDTVCKYSKVRSYA